MKEHAVRQTYDGQPHLWIVPDREPDTNYREEATPPNVINIEGYRKPQREAEPRTRSSRANPIITFPTGQTEEQPAISSETVEKIFPYERNNDSPRYTLDEYLRNIARIQRQFDSVLTKKSTSLYGDNPLHGGYNPVLDRGIFEMSTKTPEQLEKCKKYILAEIKTALCERYGVEVSEYKYLFDGNGELRNEKFPTETFETVLTRGIEYRKKLGSQENKREILERDSFINTIQKGAKGFILSVDGHTGLQSEITPEWWSFSPPGSLVDTPYVSKFIDKFKMVSDKETGEWEVKTLRYTIGKNLFEYYGITKDEYGELPLEVREKKHADYLKVAYAEYEEVLTQINPTYFENRTDSFDTHCIGNIVSANSLAEQQKIARILSQKIKTMKQANRFAKVYNSQDKTHQKYINSVTSEQYNPRNHATSYNELLTNYDNLMVEEHIKRKYSDPRTGILLGPVPIVAGCGLSAGFSLNTGIFANSVVQFGMLGIVPPPESSCIEIVCPECDWKPTSFDLQEMSANRLTSCPAPKLDSAGKPIIDENTGEEVLCGYEPKKAA